MYFSLSSMFLIFLHVLLHFYDEDTWRRICLCSCEYVGTVKPPCECMCGRKKWPGPARVLPNTLLSLLEPCLAVILKKSELRTDGGGSPRLFFLFFLYFFDIFLHFFVWEYCNSGFSVAWITSIKETVGRDKRNIQLILHCVMNKI